VNQSGVSTSRLGHPGVRFDRRELAGAVADVGVLVPIAVALIVGNGLSATAVLLPAGLLYLTAALVYRLPIPVQPLKAFGAIAIAKGLGSDEIAAGALLMGVIFIVLGRLGVLDLAARGVPRALVRGVQLTVGLLFLKIAWELVTDPPTAFVEQALEPAAAVPLGLMVLGLALALKQQSVSLALVAAGGVTMLVLKGGELSLGPSAVELPSLDGETLLTALTVLVVPQLPLSFANSCLATADAARTYFGELAGRVRPGRLATTFGSANLLAGSISGMPVCHGAGGLTAHYAFGARTAAAPAAMGLGLIVLSVGFGAGLAPLLSAFPLPILAGLLAAAGVLHIGLLRDLSGWYNWMLALVVGAVGFQLNLTIALLLGLAAWWLPRAGRALLERPAFGA
jgi:sulfate permease, SulP family